MQPEKQSRAWWWVAILVLGITLALYAQIVGHPFICYDDLRYLVLNPAVSQPSMVSWTERLLTPRMTYVVPVTTNFQALLYWLGQGQAWIFHLASLLLHLGTVVLAVDLLRRLKAAPLWSGLALALFALHPAIVEPIAWAAGTKDMLVGFWGLLAVWSFVRAHQKTPEEPARPWLVAAVLAAVLAIFSKPTAVLMGGALLAWLIARAWKQGRRGATSSWVAAALVLVLGLASALISRSIYYEQDTQGAEALARGDFQVFLSLGHHLSHLLWPTQLHPAYLIDRTAGFSDPLAWLGLVGLVALLALAWLARKTPAVLLGLALAVVFYLPVSSILPFAHFVADSYLYLPALGLAIALASALTLAAQRLPQERAQLWRRLLAGLLGATALALLPMSALQVARWQGGPALWEPMIEDHPDWYLPRQLLGEAHFMRGEMPQAAVAFRSAARFSLDRRVLGTYGLSLGRSGQLEDAECVMITAVFYDNSGEDHLWNLAILLSLHPEYQVKHPEVVGALLHQFASELPRRPRGWPEPLREPLQQRLRQLKPSTGGELSWKPRQCAALAPAP